MYLRREEQTRELPAEQKESTVQAMFSSVRLSKGPQTPSTIASPTFSRRTSLPTVCRSCGTVPPLLPSVWYDNLTHEDSGATLQVGSLVASQAACENRRLYDRCAEEPSASRFHESWAATGMERRSADDSDSPQDGPRKAP